ncbi:hypothetical protein MUP37_01780 [Candidatus Bathyarchaeota archaeon]|nr:hypothetical protein [Candidatus Bathyarchaeota archaeon]
MTILKKTLHIILLTSFSMWLTVLFMMFSPTTGLLTTNLSGSINKSILDLFLVSGVVAGATCFIVGVEMFEPASAVFNRPIDLPQPLSNRNSSDWIVPQKQIQDLRARAEKSPNLSMIHFETEMLRLAERRNTIAWRREVCVVQGKIRTTFRAVETGRFIKNPQSKRTRPKH